MGKELAPGSGGMKLGNNDVLMEPANEHGEISIVMVVSPIMLVEEEEPSMGMEVSLTL